MKLKVFRLLAAAVIITATLYACKNMKADDAPGNVEIINLADTIEINDAAQVLQVSEELFYGFTELKKANDNYTLLSIREAGSNAKIDSAQAQVLNADKAFRQTLERVELNNTNLQSQLAINSLYHIISSYRFLQKFQHFETVTGNMVGAKNTYSTTMPQMQNNPAQQMKIVGLEQQIKFLQNNIASSKSTSQKDPQQNQKSAEQEAKIAELEKQVKFLQSATVGLKNALQSPRQQTLPNPAHDAKIAELEQKIKSLQSASVSSKNTTTARIQQPQNNSTQEAKIATLERQVESLRKNQTKNKNILSPAEYEEMASKIKYLNFDLRSVIKTNLALNQQYEDLKKTNLALASELSKLRNK